MVGNGSFQHPHRQSRKRRKSRQKDDEEPFIYLMLKVGGSILFIGWVATHVILLFSSPRSQRSAGSSSHHPSPHSIIASTARGAGDSNVFPEFHLDPRRSKSDAFGIHDTVAKHNNQDGSKEFYDEAARLKEEFASRYGGENAARYLIHAGVTTFDPSGDLNNVNTENFDAHDMSNVPSGIMHTAYRILRARNQNRPFKIAFGGYSVSAGRGNYFNQSFPFVMQNLLQRPMKHLGIELRVRNAAIGGVPSFPYGWCLGNFLGDDVDVISWDYSMNEAGGISDGLEAYIRHGLSMKNRPMLIVKDTSAGIAKERYNLLQSYVDNGVLKDPIVLSIEDAIDSFLRLNDAILPTGFHEWRKFGAPKGAPGQTSHHPAVKEHELYGWLLTMHFLVVLELVAFLLSKENDTTFINNLASEVSPIDQKMMLHAPIHGKAMASEESFSLFYGYDTTANDPGSKSMSWKMNPVHCRTTYDPILSNNLKDIVISGTVGEDLDIMFPRGAQHYNKGWVLDLGESEKTAKKKLQRYGGLGYIDSKKAYYGIKSSGPLEIFLPCIGRNDILHKMQINDDEVPASECFRNVVLCEVNEKHPTGDECNLNNDLSFEVGGFKSEDAKPVNATGAFYWGRNICIHVAVPSDSGLSKRDTVDGLSTGMLLTISVANSSVMRRSGPCSISHIIWEQTDNIKPSK